MRNRENAIKSLEDKGQDVHAESLTGGKLAYYVERDGEITADQYVGNSHERQSVYFNQAGAAMRLGDVGLGSCGYNGAETDIRELVAISADQSAMLPPGKFYGDYIHPSDLPATIDAEHGVYWDGSIWCVTGDLLSWSDVQEEHPCQSWIDDIAALPHGWFADEA